MLRRFELGLSLLEFLVVLGLLGSTLLLSLPNLGAAGGLVSAQREARMLESKITALPVLAIQGNQPVSLEISERGAQLITGSAILWQREWLAAYTIVSKPKLPLTLKAFPTGSVSPATVILADDSQRCTLRVSLRGRVERSCEQL